MTPDPRRTYFRALGSAFTYFSTLPIASLTLGDVPIASALLWLPLVGAVIGGLAGGIDVLAGHWLPAPIPALLGFSALVLGSGAIHLDGFFDSCDALCATVTPQRRHEILKDPRCGSFALAGGAILVPLWISAIASVNPQHVPAALALAGALGRWAAILNGLRIPYGSAGFAAAAFTGPLPRLALLIWGLVLASAAMLLTGSAFALIGVVVGLSLLLGEWSRRRLGGCIVGDVYGALAVILEVVCLLGLIASR